MEVLEVKTSDEPKKKYLPMKLCFKPKILIGNSYIHIGLPAKISKILDKTEILYIYNLFFSSSCSIKILQYKSR